ncbi:MAG: GNAT family N-acetyltransferase, partial [Promethearchaeota archaeon]
MSLRSDLNIEFRIADNETFVDLNLCAKEFIDFIDNFKTKFLNKEFFVLTAYLNEILVGILVAEDKSKKVDSLEKIVPIMRLYLLFVNPNFRNKNIGENLLKEFLNIQKGKGIAYIYIRIPQIHKEGIKYLRKNNFQQVGKKAKKIILEFKLWNDFGIMNCQSISDIFNHIF